MWECHYVKEMEGRHRESRLRTWEGWKRKKLEKEGQKSIPLRRIANQNFIVAD